MIMRRRMSRKEEETEKGKEEETERCRTVFWRCWPLLNTDGKFCCHRLNCLKEASEGEFVLHP